MLKQSNQRSSSPVNVQAVQSMLDQPRTILLDLLDRYVNSKRRKQSYDTVSPTLHASLLFEATAFKHLHFF